MEAGQVKITGLHIQGVSSLLRRFYHVKDNHLIAFIRYQPCNWFNKFKCVLAF